MTDRSKMTATERKDSPLFRGLFKYFPDALMEVAHLSKVGNEQHNPGQPLHWAKEKSSDEGDALLRHQLDAGTRDTDGERHSTKVAWRALAQLQREIEAEHTGNNDGRIWMGNPNALDPMYQAYTEADPQDYYVGSYREPEIK